MTFRRSSAVIRKAVKKHWLMVLAQPHHHHEAAARANRHLNVPAARLERFIPKACPAKPQNQIRVCAGASAKSSSKRACPAYLTTPS
jgi:hypothetical protein